MENEHLIPASHVCVHYNIDTSFLHALQDYGLVHVVTQNEAFFLDADDLNHVEKMIHLHQDLDINLEGIDAIMQLLRRMERLQDEMAALRNRLRLYESGA